MYYCGPAALAKTLKVKTLAATTKNVQFTFAKEHFVRRPCSPIHTLTLPPSDLSMELAEIELCVLPLRMLPRRKRSECERGAEEGGKGTGVSGEIIRVHHKCTDQSMRALSHRFVTPSLVMIQMTAPQPEYASRSTAFNSVCEMVSNRSSGSRLGSHSDSAIPNSFSDAVPDTTKSYRTIRFRREIEEGRDGPWQS